MKCEKKRGIKVDFQVCDLDKLGNDSGIYEDKKDLEMIIFESMCLEQIKGSTLGL